MGVFNFIFSGGWRGKKNKKQSILTEEDKEKLKEIERVAYMKSAEELIKKRGEANATKDLGVKEIKDKWQM